MSTGDFPSLFRDREGRLLPLDRIIRRGRNRTRPDRTRPDRTRPDRPVNDGDPGGVITPEDPPNRNTGRDLHLPRNWNTNNSGARYTTSLSSEPNDGQLTWLFDPDPISIHWDIQMLNQVTPTRGGQVTYAKFRQIGPLTIMGKLRSTYDLLQFAQFIQDHMVEAQIEGKSLLFEYPERDVAFFCYARAFPRIGIETYKNGDMVPLYQLILDITRDHVPLDSIPLSELGIPEEVGWVPVSEAAQKAEAERPGSTLTTPQERGEDSAEGLDEEEQAPSSSPPGS